MRSIQFVDLYSQYDKIKPEIDCAIQQVIDNSAFIGGQPVASFELALKTYLQVDHVIPCGNGTDALQLALMALDLNPGDEVIVPGFTFVAPAEAIALLKLVPVFADVDFNTFNLTAETIAPLITPKTRAIIVVHLFGQSANMQPILELARSYNLKVIEDVAQALGARTTINGGKYAGTVGDIGCTSFFPSKNLACFGDGGAVFSNNEELAKRIKMIANHGQPKKYTHDLIGINSRLDGLQAAILEVKLKYLSSYLAARKECAKRYDALLKNISWLQIPHQENASEHTYNQYTLILNPSIDRERLIAYLKDQGIPTMVYYPTTLPKQNAYASFGKQVLSVSEELAKRVLSLPMHTELSIEQQQYICLSLKDYKL